jgi:DNA-binding HxlR family transcriptional regulator
MAAMDLLGQRWTLRILWELRRGPIGARDLKRRCDQMSSSVLYDRLRDLADAHLIQGGGADAYVLTDLGVSLGAALEPLDAWATKWSARTSRHPKG